MKLALIRQRYNAYGGAERFVELAVSALSAGGGASVTLVTRDWKAGQGGDSVLQCDPFYLGRTWRDRSFARAACRATRSGFDLVQSHERIACCDVYRAGDGVHAQWLENRARAGGPLAGLAARLSPWHRYTLAAERRLFADPRLKAVICNSRMVAGEIQRRFGLASERLRVIYSGVDSQRFHPRLRAEWRARRRQELGIPATALVFLLVGSGFERKGVPRLLAAMRDAASDAHLVVVGADRRLAAARARAAALGLAARAHFPGPQAAIETWYAAADCFVLPALYDPFPNAALEAMASGLPIITSRQCGAAELVEEASCGEVCDAWDSAALGALLRGMDHSRAEAMGARSRALAEQHTPQAMAARMSALYGQLLGS